MTMNETRIKEAFLELLRCGMWGRKPTERYFTGLTPNDWTAVYRMAGKQTVIGICLIPIRELPETLRPPQQVLLNWIGGGRYIEMRSRKIADTWKELNSRFEAAGIRPVLMKGISVARWYYRPELRQASDIDLYLPEKFDEAIALVHSWGIRTEHKRQHDSLVYKEVPIEIHPEIITVPFKPELTCHLTEEQAGSLTIRVADVHTTSLLLLSHAANHFIIPGIGYRHLCDWAVFLKHNHEKINCNLIREEARRMGMDRFVAEFTELAHTELGLTFDGIEQWTQGAQQKYTRRMSERIREQGDFGNVNFQKDFHGSKLRFGADLIAGMLKTKYYWPRLFWKKVPRFVRKLVFNYLKDTFSRKTSRKKA